MICLSELSFKSYIVCSVEEQSLLFYVGRSELKWNDSMIDDANIDKQIQFFSSNISLSCQVM